MAILNALGLKAVGLKRRLPFLSFLTWFFSGSRALVYTHSRPRHTPHNQRQHQNKPAYFIILLLALFMGMYASTRQFAPVVFLETMILDLSAPVVGSLQRSFSFIGDLTAQFRSFQDLQRELVMVKEQNKSLLQMNMKLKQAAFLQKETLKVTPLFERLSAENILESRAFQVPVLNTPAIGQPMILGVPKVLDDNETGIEKNYSVLGSQGLLGRVVHVGFTAAKVITIFDATSRIPVDIKGVQGIAAGQRTHTLKLIHIKDAQHTLKVGDAVYTSGFGGIFQKGLPLGYISRIENKAIEITPFETGDASHVVTVIEHLPAFES